MKGLTGWEEPVYLAKVLPGDSNMILSDLFDEWREIDWTTRFRRLQSFFIRRVVSLMVRNIMGQYLHMLLTLKIIAGY